jgi:beta-galactosidase
VEEFAPPAEPSVTGGAVPTLAIEGLAAGTAEEWGEIVRVDDAEVLAAFVGGMLDGRPAITRRRDGGTAWYVATAPQDLAAVVDAVLAEAGVLPEVPDLPEEVEAVRRGGRLFLLNHGEQPVEVRGTRLQGRDAAVLDERSHA